MAENGWGQPQNYAEALSWFYKAAEHGSDTAKENIGYMFQHGMGVQTDHARAISCFVDAAAHVDIDEPNLRCWVYQFGQGGEPVDANAVAWHRMAANQGNRRGLVHIRAFVVIRAAS